MIEIEISVPSRVLCQNMTMFRQTDRFRWEEEVKIEQKLFLMRMGVGGNSICLTEPGMRAIFWKRILVVEIGLV